MNSLFLSRLTPLVLLSAIAVSARANVFVDASKTIRARPIGIGGTVIDAHSPRFATGADGIDSICDSGRESVCGSV